MPTMPLTRDTAWDHWSRGLIAAANIDLTFESFSNPSDPAHGYWRNMLANLTLKRNYNAFRLWFGYADRFSIYPSDIATIAFQGWNSTAATSGGNTVAGVAAQVTNILDTAQKLGAGIFLVTDFYQGPGGLLWSTKSTDVVQDPATGINYTYRDVLKKFWVNTLTKWKDHSALIGLDILNEPNPGDSPQYDANGNAVFDAKLSSYRAQPNGWPQLAQTIITAIRAAETQLQLTTRIPLIVEGIYVGGPNGLMVFDVPGANGGASSLFLQDGTSPRIVYSFHYYGPGCVTGQGVDEWNYESMGTAYPMPGVSYDPYWYDGIAHGDFYTHASADDMKRDIANAITFKTNHPAAPIFVGEFSCCQPSIAQVYPPDPNRATNTPSVRVSEVQNTILWQAPNLAKLGAVTTQAQANALLAAQGAASEQVKLYNEVFTGTKRRWITKLEVSADGKKLTATLDHTADPADVDAGGFNYGFRVWTSPLTVAQLGAFAQSVNEPAVPSRGTQFATKFTNQPNARVIGRYDWIDGSNQAQSVNLTASALHMTASQSVTLVRHATTIEFVAPAGAVAGTTLVGATVNLPYDASDLSKTKAVQMPVALLWLESPLTGAQIDQARVNWAQDALNTWQANGFSWAWHAEDSGGPAGVVMWRPSKAIGELLSIAATGRRIAARS